MDERHEEIVRFTIRQLLDALAPSNFPATNPEVLAATVEERGHNLWCGWRNWLEDVTRAVLGRQPVGAASFVVGQDVAISKGKVIHRNRLVELIQYRPTTPQNSLVRFLVDSGHTVFMLSWKNPDAGDRDLGLDDYLRLGVLEPLGVVRAVCGETPVHAVGYCLGGTLLAIAAATIGRDGGAQTALQSLTKINRGLDVSQTRVTTGLRVNGPKDDASSYTIAQRMRGAVAGNESVKIALANGESVVNTAVEAGKSISDLLIEMKAKVVQANQAGLDSSSRSALQNDFDGLRTQIATIVASASFNSTNLIDASATTFTVLSTQEGSTITVSAQKLDTTTLGIQSSDLTSSANAATALSSINSAISLVADKLAALGSAAKRIDVQTEFTGKLTDILKQGIGNLVDADLAEESANLQSLQIRQQLGTQALSIANQRPSSILSLFR